MRLNPDEKRTLLILLRLEELERGSELVSKIKAGQYPCEMLLKEMGDLSKVRLEFVPGAEKELRGLLANLILHAKVLGDLCGENLMETYETAAEKLRGGFFPDSHTRRLPPYLLR